jgi:hypothetical protein
MKEGGVSWLTCFVYGKSWVWIDKNRYSTPSETSPAFLSWPFRFYTEGNAQGNVDSHFPQTHGSTHAVDGVADGTEVI